MWNNVILNGSKNCFKPNADSQLFYNKIATDISDLNKTINILDIGCGSGALGLSLKKNLPELVNTVVCTDINTTAIEYTQKNIVTNNLSNITCYVSDMFEEIPAQQFDIIISNIPFLNYEDIMNIEWSTFIPLTSIIVGNSSDRDILLNKLILQGTMYLKPQGYLYFQVGTEEQKERMINLLYNNGYIDIIAFNDIHDYPYFIRAKKEN